MYPYVLFLFLIKISFLLIVILQKTGVIKKNAPIAIFIHQLFLSAFAIFMLWIFRPMQKTILIQGEIKYILFFFGILLMIDTKWKEFLKSAIDIF